MIENIITMAGRDRLPDPIPADHIAEQGDTPEGPWYPVPPDGSVHRSYVRFSPVRLGPAESVILSP